MTAKLSASMVNALRYYADADAARRSTALLPQSNTIAALRSRGLIEWNAETRRTGLSDTGRAALTDAAPTKRPPAPVPCPACVAGYPCPTHDTPSTPGTAAAEVVRRAGIHVIDAEHVAPGAVRLTVQPGNGRHAAAALIRAGWDASTAHDETGTRVLAVEPEPDPADLDDAPAVAAYATTAARMTPDGLARAGAHHRCRMAVTTGHEHDTEARLLAVIRAEQDQRRACVCDSLHVGPDAGHLDGCPAALVDPAPAETYGTTPGATWPPQSSRYRN